MTARRSFGEESVSVRSRRQEAINESIPGPPESSYVSIATASETSQRSCRARHHEGSPPNHCFCGWNPGEAHDAAVRSGVRDSDGGRNPDIAQHRSEILHHLPGLRRSGHQHRTRGGAGAPEWLPGPTHRSRAAGRALFGQIVPGIPEWSRIHADEFCAHACRTAALRNRFTVAMVSRMNSARTTSCIITNGGSVCLGAIALSTETCKTAWTTPTKTFR